MGDRENPIADRLEPIAWRNSWVRGLRTYRFGRKRRTLRFFYISKGSLAELRTQIRIALEVGFLDKDEFAKIELDCSEIGKMLGGLIKHRSGEVR